MVIRVLETVDRTERVVRNPLSDPAFISEPPTPDALAVHQRMPGYQPSPLIDLPVIARELGLERLLAEG